MTVLRFNQLSLAYGATPLLDGVSAQLARGERVCLIGRNGSGKSSLLRVIKGEVQADSGEIWKANGLVIGELPQELPEASERTVFEQVALGLAENGRLLAEYQHLSQHIKTDDDLARLSHIQHQLEACDGWQLQQRVESTLSRLQLPADKTRANYPAAGGDVCCWRKPWSRNRMCCSWMSRLTIWILARPFG